MVSKKIMGITAFLFLLALLGVLVYVHLSRTMGDKRVTLVSEVPGYSLRWNNYGKLVQILNEKRVFTKEIFSYTTGQPTRVSRIVLQLTDKEQPLLPIRWKTPGQTITAVSGNYSIHDTVMTISLHITPGPDGLGSSTFRDGALNGQLYRLLSWATVNPAQAQFLLEPDYPGDYTVSDSEAYKMDVVEEEIRTSYRLDLPFNLGAWWSYPVRITKN